MREGRGRRVFVVLGPLERRAVGDSTMAGEGLSMTLDDAERVRGDGAGGDGDRGGEARRTRFFGRVGVSTGELEL